MGTGVPADIAGWRDAKRYLWLLAAAVPCLVGLSWFAVLATGWSWLWWLGSLLTFAVMPLSDYLIGRDGGEAPDSAYIDLDQDRFYRWTTYLYLPNQYGSLLLACWLWSGGGWLSMAWVDKLGLMITVGIIGGIGINAAHELGHKRQKLEKRLSKLALAQTGYGHFFVEHNYGHHVNVATPTDPASSRLGESVYRFVPRSVRGGLRSAWRLESARCRRRGTSPWTLRNHVLSAWLLTALLFLILAVWFGPVVLPWLVGQAVVGFCLLETVNYLEHYGLRRRLLADGQYERVGPGHSWNSNTVVANVVLYHLQRHSDHHVNPARRFQTLRSCESAPQLPAGYGAMFVLALIPPLWGRVMDRRVIAHYDGDITMAALDPHCSEKVLRRYASEPA
ncbi:MAG: alkane 1-monooxygenase [Mycobacterium sp.]